MKPIKRMLLYLLLAAGSVVFSIPFIWMATTSVKVDRELFAEEFTIWPLAPQPRMTSPYIDPRYYGKLEGPQQDRLADAFAAVGRQTGFALPADVDSLESWKHIGRGLYDRMWRSLPVDIWRSPSERIVEAARNAITRSETERVFYNVVRRLSFSQIRVRSKNLEVQELGEDIPFDRRLDNRDPETVTVHETMEKTLRFASLNYRFDDRDAFTLSRTFDLDFDVQNLDRIQLHLRPDDSWHELWLTVEKMGVRYVSERPLVLANFGWITATWQEPGPDDRSTKIRTWTLLHEESRSPEYIRDPRRMKLTFEIRRSSLAGAWMNKIGLNYIRVLDYIPFWRYVQTSVFLVLVNIILNLLSCSLVAFAFSRLRWPGRDLCFILMLATMMIPPQVTMIPHFLIWKAIGAYDTLSPLWVGHALGSAFFIFLLRQFMKSIPRDLEDAARIDGCGFLRIYWHIILPLIKPSLATIAIFTFMGTWNDFMGPLIYIADQRLYPLAFGLYAFAVQVGNNPALTMAGGLLMTLPVIFIFAFEQRYFIQGATLTGMKG